MGRFYYCKIWVNLKQIVGMGRMNRVPCQGTYHLRVVSSFSDSFEREEGID